MATAAPKTCGTRRPRATETAYLRNFHALAVCRARFQDTEPDLLVASHYSARRVGCVSAWTVPPALRMPIAAPCWCASTWRRNLFRSDRYLRLYVLRVLPVRTSMAMMNAFPSENMRKSGPYWRRPDGFGILGIWMAWKRQRGVDMSPVAVQRSLPYAMRTCGPRERRRDRR